MKGKAIAWTLFGLSVALPPAYADESAKAFYNKCLETEIQHCQVRAERVSSRSDRIRKDAEKASAQARYYETNRSALVEQMEQERVSTKNHKIHRYLLDSYYESRLVKE
jgi:hypothetical protein